MNRLAMMTLTHFAFSTSGTGDDEAVADGDPDGGGECARYSDCELTSQEDFAAAIGSTIEPHEKPQGNTKQIYHCAVDASGSDPFADVAINCRTDGRSHEQYLLAHDVARDLPGFEEIADLGQAAFWLPSVEGSGSLEVEMDDQRVLIVSVYSVPDGMELPGARALATTVLDRL
jgi:hypothetical protein